MTFRIRSIVLLFQLLAAAAAAGAQTTAAPSTAAAPSLATNISRLADLDYRTRMNAARLIRRAPAAAAVPALKAAVLDSKDEFVRYRALVLLTGFEDRDTAGMARSLISDHNDRVREVAYRWLELHPDVGLAPTLLASLAKEQAEFVRPALVRALAAIGTDPAVRRALIAEAGRGLDFFRIGVIDAFGQARAAWAVPTLIEITAIDGPLRDDAVLALGRIGDPKALPIITALPATPPELGLSVQAARCMLGDDCTARLAALSEGVKSRVARPEAVLAGVTGLGAIAATSDAGLAVLADLLGSANVHDQAEIGLGGAALRNPAHFLKWIAGVPEAQRAALIEGLRDAFERYEEDFAEEQFFAATRAAYWAAADGSASRMLMASLIDKLDF